MSDFDVEDDDLRFIQFVFIQAELDNVRELIRQRNISFGEFK